MKNIMTKKDFLLMLPLVLVLVLLFLSFTTVLKASTFDKKSKFKIITSFKLEYNSNVFKLTDSQIDRYNEGSLLNDRFKEMNTVSDYIISPWIKLKYKFKAFKQKVELNSKLQYNVYYENTEKSYFNGDFEIVHKTGKSGKLVFKEDVTYGFFRKNYLSGENNEGSTDNISQSERIYSMAKYNEYESSLSYENKLVTFGNEKGKKYKISWKLYLKNELRKYNSVFKNRDRNTFFLGGGFKLKHHKNYNYSIYYTYGKRLTSKDDELILIDETVNNIDLTGDGELTKNAGLYTSLDRSADLHIIKFKFLFTPLKKWSFGGTAAVRKLYYNTSNELDCEHFEKDELRQYYSLETSYNFMKNFSTKLKYKFIYDDSDEGVFYVNKINLSISYKF